MPGELPTQPTDEEKLAEGEVLKTEPVEGEVAPTVEQTEVELAEKVEEVEQQIETEGEAMLERVDAAIAAAEASAGLPPETSAAIFEKGGFKERIGNIIQGFYDGLVDAAARDPLLSTPLARLSSKIGRDIAQRIYDRYNSKHVLDDRALLRHLTKEQVGAVSYDDYVSPFIDPDREKYRQQKIDHNKLVAENLRKTGHSERLVDLVPTELKPGDVSEDELFGFMVAGDWERMGKILDKTPSGSLSKNLADRLMEAGDYKNVKAYQGKFESVDEAVLTEGLEILEVCDYCRPEQVAKIRDNNLIEFFKNSNHWVKKLLQNNLDFFIAKQPDERQTLILLAGKMGYENVTLDRLLGIQELLAGDPDKKESFENILAVMPHASADQLRTIQNNGLLTLFSGDNHASYDGLLKNLDVLVERPDQHESLLRILQIFPNVNPEQLRVIQDHDLSRLFSGYESDRVGFLASVDAVVLNHELMELVKSDPNFSKSIFKNLSLFVEHPDQRDKFLDIIKTIPYISQEQLMSLHHNNLWDLFKNNPEITNDLFKILDKLIGISMEKREVFVRLIKEIKLSPSQEIKRIVEPLLQAIVDVDDPEKAYRQVEDIFIKNNLPLAGKLLKVFQVLYPENSNVWETTKVPTLKEASPRKREYLIYQDLLKVHIESGETSLKDYLALFNEALPLIAQQETGSESLDESQKRRLQYLLRKVQTLKANSVLGESGDPSVGGGSSLEDDYKSTLQDMGVQNGAELVKKLEDMFLRPAGYSSIGEVLAKMDSSKKEADARNRELANGDLFLKPGDLIKGVQSRSLGYILDRGILAREFMGAESSSDMTPLDTDASRVPEAEDGKRAEEIMDASLSGGYGDLFLIIKNRGQFELTSKEHTQSALGKDKKYDLSNSAGDVSVNNKHYGVRTGLASTEIGALVWRSSDSPDRIFTEVAQKGFYIPVFDNQGKLLFTPEDYAKYREAFGGIERFGGDPLKINLKQTERVQKQVWETQAELVADKEKTRAIADNIKQTVVAKLGSLGINLREPGDTGILGAEFSDIGSTGRHTNMPHSYDFDFSVRLDQGDFDKSGVVENLKQLFVFEKDDSHESFAGSKQIRLGGVSKIGDIVLAEPIDIDIGVISKNQPFVYGSHDALGEKLGWVEKNLGAEARDQVTANIVSAKKILKEAKAYKKLEDGGMGGVGVETWILANGGNMEQAFKSFWEAAHDGGAVVSLEDFQKKYPIIDAGLNLRDESHDNFVFKLKPEGYQAMLKAIEPFV